MNIFLVKPGVESFFIAECSTNSITTCTESTGLISTNDEISEDSEFCFPFWILYDISIIKSASLSHTIESVCSWYCEQIRDIRIDSQWKLFWLTCGDNGFTPDTSKQNRLKDSLKKRISRISKLADSAYPHIDKKVSGLYVVEDPATGKIFLSLEASFGGQRRMKDDPQAPSRSYLKIEEAFAAAGKEPLQGEVVADLGAAPGGWTWAALKRGATVYAIDNGPLKNGPLNHPAAHHLRCDAFTWEPDTVPVDWLFCDMVEQPLLVLDRIKVWFSNGWCKNAVVNFKYGYSDPVKVLDSIYNRDGLQPFTKKCICRHLFHDRDELTVIAEIQRE